MQVTEVLSVAMRLTILSNFSFKDIDLKNDNDQSMKSCFSTFDVNQNNVLEKGEFKTLCQKLFQNVEKQAYDIDEKQLKEMFEVFDKNNDRFINLTEFTFCWKRWIKIIVHPVSIFIGVDVQNDFLTGTLALDKAEAHENGLDVVEPIVNLVKQTAFYRKYLSLDWHPTNHLSFIENVKSFMVGDLHNGSRVNILNESWQVWDKHCVHDTAGAKLHESLKVLPDTIPVYIGTKSTDLSNSALDALMVPDGLKTLREEINALGVTDVYACGIATDVCVGDTILDALRSKYRTILIDDCSRGINKDTIAATKDKILKQHGVIVDSSQVAAMVNGYDRNPILGYKLAMDLK